MHTSIVLDKYASGHVCRTKVMDSPATAIISIAIPAAIAASVASAIISVAVSASIAASIAAAA